MMMNCPVFPASTTDKVPVADAPKPKYARPLV
jgi:hypothetical protein